MLRPEACCPMRLKQAPGSTPDRGGYGGARRPRRERLLKRLRGRASGWSWSAFAWADQATPGDWHP
eukprot:4460622-Alexandrium_andersonii.AAC.2